MKRRRARLRLALMQRTNELRGQRRRIRRRLRLRAAVAQRTRSEARPLDRRRRVARRPGGSLVRGLGCGAKLSRDELVNAGVRAAALTGGGASAELGKCEEGEQARQRRRGGSADLLAEKGEAGWVADEVRVGRGVVEEDAAPEEEEGGAQLDSRREEELEEVREDADREHLADRPTAQRDEAREEHQRS